MLAVVRRIRVESIQTRLIVFFLLFGIVPAVCLLSVYFWFKGSIEVAYREPIKDTAIALGDVIDRNLFERYGDVQAFGVNAAAWAPENWRNPASTNPLVSAMNSYMTNYGLYRLMILVDTKVKCWRSIASISTGKVLGYGRNLRKELRGASWFTKAIKGEFLQGSNGLTGTVVEQPATNDVVAALYKSDGYVVTFAAPVKNGAGELIGVWVNFADFGLVEEIVTTFYKSLADSAAWNGRDHRTRRRKADHRRLRPDGARRDLCAQPRSHRQTEPRRAKASRRPSPPSAASSGAILSMHERKRSRAGCRLCAYRRRLFLSRTRAGRYWCASPDNVINVVANEVALWMPIALGVSALRSRSLLGSSAAASRFGLEPHDRGHARARTRQSGDRRARRRP